MEVRSRKYFVCVCVYNEHLKRVLVWLQTSLCLTLLCSKTSSLFVLVRWWDLPSSSQVQRLRTEEWEHVSCNLSTSQLSVLVSLRNSMFSGDCNSRVIKLYYTVGLIQWDKQNDSILPQFPGAWVVIRYHWVEGGGSACRLLVVHKQEVGHQSPMRLGVNLERTDRLIYKHTDSFSDSFFPFLLCCPFFLPSLFLSFLRNTVLASSLSLSPSLSLLHFPSHLSFRLLSTPSFLLPQMLQ